MHCYNVLHVVILCVIVQYSAVDYITVYIYIYIYIYVVVCFKHPAATPCKPGARRWNDTCMCICTCVCIYIYIYIYNTYVCIHMYIYIYREREREKERDIHILCIQEGTVRFDSFWFRTFRKLIGSVRFGSDNMFCRFDAVPPAFFGHAVARSGPVRFGSVLRAVLLAVPAGSRIKLFGSVRSIRFGSVSHSFLALVPPVLLRRACCMYCKQAVR